MNIEGKKRIPNHKRNKHEKDCKINNDTPIDRNSNGRV